MAIHLRHRHGLLTTVSVVAAIIGMPSLWASGYLAGQEHTPAKTHTSTVMPGMEHATNIDAVCATDLPKEALDTEKLILKGGPYPYPKNDGVIFKNKEGLLPQHQSGYYHEFTVKTPGAHNRGTRRIITGGAEDDQVEDYYTGDHYESFSLIDYSCDDSGKPTPHESDSPTPSPSATSDSKPRHPEDIKNPICVNKLPDEAFDTLDLIWKGGPFPYKQDGTVFDNRPSNPLPEHKNGYYHEYTVETPGSDDRGARRIVTGGDPADQVEDWWTDDHYRTFRAIDYSPSCDTTGPNELLAQEDL